jgi:hypothetical protein
VIIEFDGGVKCSSCSGAVNLRLHGRSRRAGIAPSVCETDVLFAGADTQDLPGTLHDVRVTELNSSIGLQRFRIESVERGLELQARGIQVHRDAGESMFKAVPPQAVPWRVRAGWSLLLSLLGVPGVGALILRNRGES